MELTLEKTTAECYKIKGTDGCFATITLDYVGERGRVSIASDFGNYSHFWGSCGRPFKEFLCGLNLEYAAGKFDQDNWFDEEATLSNLKSRIDEYAETKDQRKALMKEFRELENMSGRDEFMVQLAQSDEIMKMECSCPDMVRAINPGFRRFWDVLWKFFVQSLKTELVATANAL